MTSPLLSAPLVSLWRLIAPLALVSVALVLAPARPSLAQGAQPAQANTGKLSAKERAKIAFRQGSQAFSKERWAEALDRFEEAYQAYPLPLMIFNIASTYERLGDLPKALERYEAFIATGKDDGDAAARVKAIKGQLEAWSELRLSSEPSGAEVFVGSTAARPRGKTPLTLKLPANQTLSITLKKSGYLNQSLSPRLSPKGRRTLKVTMKGEPAFVRVLGAPKEATVKVNGKTLEGATGLPFTRELGVGVYELEISAPGYIPQRKTITLKKVHSEGAPLVIEVSLASSERVALLNLTADQEGALLFVNGQPAGQTPLSAPLKLKQGEHLIELKGAQGGLYSERVTLKNGETKRVHAQLSSSLRFTKRHIGYTLASVGAASLIGGLISGGLALSSSGELEDCRASFACARRQGELDLAQELRAYSSAADWMLGLGLALAAGGVTLVWIDMRATQLKPSLNPEPSAETAVSGSADDRFKARFSLSPSPGGLSAVGGFNF